MKIRTRPRIIYGTIWVIVLVAGMLWFFLYSQLPADGSSGDLSSFGKGGFQVKWILSENHEIYPGDIIQKINGRTIEEQLRSFNSINHFKRNIYIGL